MGLCSHMPVKNDHIHSTQLLVTVSEKPCITKIKHSITFSHQCNKTLTRWLYQQKHASQLFYESLLYTIGLLTFSAAIFTKYLTRSNQMKKATVNLTILPIRYYSDTAMKALLRFPVCL